MLAKDYLAIFLLYEVTNPANLKDLQDAVPKNGQDAVPKNGQDAVPKSGKDAVPKSGKDAVPKREVYKEKKNGTS